MLSIDKLIASAKSCLGWPYVSPGSNDSRGIDCSGLFVKAYRDQGAGIYHGSNTIWRKHLSEKGEIRNPSQLIPGMAVFKHKDQDTPKYPDGQGDFCHIGLVVRKSPDLQIIHASSAAGKVITDTKIGKWAFWGKLAAVDYGTGSVDNPSAGAEPPEGASGGQDGHLIVTATVCSENGKPVKLRARPSTTCKLYDSIPVGTVVTVTRYRQDWCEITYQSRKSWYMKTEFLSFG